MGRQTARYGWKPDLPDFRDLYYKDVHYKAVVAPVDPQNGQHQDHILPIGFDATGLPLGVSLRPKLPPVFNQGQLGSCTANAAGLMWAFVHGGGPYSRLQIYYNERLRAGTLDRDSGAYLRDAIQVLVNDGAGLEQDWPYVESNFKMPPPPVELAEAAANKATAYSRLETRADFRNCLAQGFPFIVGISIFNSFENDAVAHTGIVPMPDRSEQMVGGHAVCVVGYDSTFNGGDYYEVRNSWGEDWGDQGCFWLPAAYLENPNLACDAWTVRK